MKAHPKGVLTGAHFFDGDYACAEGAVAAGCRFLAGYPITPSTEVAERMTQRFPLVGGMFIQMEDELASMAAVVGGAWGGAKSMTVTSGPGFSLMQENIGLAAMMEVPCVVVNVQRGGPSTGLPTMVGQADIMQARWGSHGDYRLIALSPNSPQEAFDHAITCFNLAEKYRVPVLFLMDEVIGHMTERVVIPPAEEIEIEPRRLTARKPGDYKPYETHGGWVPEMVQAGDGYNIHTTGLTHDERGYPQMTAAGQETLLRRLIGKITENVDDIIILEKEDLEGADVILISYGITSRVAQAAVQKARAEGIRLGQIRLITIWPFPEKLIERLAGKIKGFVIPEINCGQIALEVERCAHGRCTVRLVPGYGGAVHDPATIYDAIKETLHAKEPKAITGC
jgi:2-oxoglutarate ferredoxin oxidoreductase subunit alpha